jgi:superfamily II DNA/RNA helicase
VIISELSGEPESHLHRIGRTGRAGEAGVALSIVEVPRELGRLQRIEALLGTPLPREPAPEHSDDLQFLRPSNRTLLIHSGRSDKIRKSDVLGRLIKDAGIPPEMIGRIVNAQELRCGGSGGLCCAGASPPEDGQDQEQAAARAAALIQSTGSLIGQSIPCRTTQYRCRRT